MYAVAWKDPDQRLCLAGTDRLLRVGLFDATGVLARALPEFPASGPPQRRGAACYWPSSASPRLRCMPRRCYQHWHRQLRPLRAGTVACKACQRRARGMAGAYNNIT